MSDNRQRKTRGRNKQAVALMNLEGIKYTEALRKVKDDVVTIVEDEKVETQWTPSYAQHPCTILTTPRGEEVEIDLGIAELIQLMWDKGMDTQFCCEGYDWNHPESGDEHSWSAIEYRSYILMPWTPRTFDLVVNLQQNFFRFSGDKRVSWTIEYEQTHHFGGMNRICIRFPKGDIPHLTQFLHEQY